MKSFNQFLGEAEDLTPEKRREAPGQQSLPGMGKGGTRTGQGSGQGKPPNKKPQYNPKYYNADGTLKPNAVQTYIQGRMAREYNRPGVSLTPETKARMDSANRTFSAAAKGDETASKQVAQWTKEFDAKHGLKNPPSTSSVPTTKPDALGQFIRKTQETGKPVSQELTDVSGIRSSGMKPELVGGAPPTTAQVNRARAAADAIKAQQQSQRRGQGSGAQTLRRLVGDPNQGMQRLQRAIDNTAPPPAPKPTADMVRPRGQGARPVGSTAPRGAARVTYGQGAAPTQSFAAFSQKATAMKPPASKEVQQRVAQAATAQAAAAKPPTIQQSVASAAKEVMSDMEKKKLERQTANATKIGKAALPVTAGLSAVNQYRYGQSQGESPATSVTRALAVPAVAGATATRVGRSLIRKKLPSWAMPAAAATYGAVEAGASKGFDMIRNMLRGKN